MKKSRLKEIIREEIRRGLLEYGSELMYYSAPGGVEQIDTAKPPRVQHFENSERWKVIAMQLGAVIQDRGDDWIAVMPNQDKIGTFNKMSQFGTLTIF